MSETAKMDESQNKNVYDALTKQQENVMKRLDRNWIIQVVLVGVGLTKIVAPNEQYLEEIPILKIDLSSPLVSVIVPCLLMYQFVRFGYLLHCFLYLRLAEERERGTLFKYHPISKQSYFNDIFSPLSFFEVFYVYHRGEFKPRNLVPYAIFGILLVLTCALNHGIVVYFIVELQSDWKYVLLLFVITLLSGCYYQFSTGTRLKGIGLISVLGYIGGAIASLVLICNY